VPFASVLGHEPIRALLARGLERGRLPHALLFAGPEGVGKKTLALAVSRALLCEGGPERPCDACRACGKILRASQKLPEWRGAAQDADDPLLANYRLHPDLVLAEPLARGVRAEIRIEQVRELVREIAGKPFEARARAFVIDEAHLMTEQAANSLLKSLEEPPVTSHVILVSASPQTLLPTIRSRCQTVRLAALPLKLLEASLVERGLAPAEARLRAMVSGGSLAAALAFEAEGYRALRDSMLDLLESVGRAGPTARLEEAQKLQELEDPMLALGALRSLLRDVAALAAGARAETLLNPDVAQRLEPLARGPLGPRAAELAEAAGETRAALLRNAHKLLSMDVLLERLAG
jgi:DNA polymerase-3 subunit delta'